MKFTNAELQIRKREGKRVRGLKELRGVYVSMDSYEEEKLKVCEFIKKITGGKNE